MTAKDYPPITEMMEACNQCSLEQMDTGAEILNSWEVKFVASLEATLKRYDSLSEKQLAKLKQIYDKVTYE